MDRDSFGTYLPWQVNGSASTKNQPVTVELAKMSKSKPTLAYFTPRAPWRFSILVFAALASGCVSLAPRYHRPESPVPNEWPASVQAPGTSKSETNIAALPWREFVSSPKLEGLIELALQNNRDLRVAVLNVERARALYRIQRADRVPNLSVNGALRRQRLPEGASFTGQAGVTEQYSATVGASFELDLFGRVHNLSRAALEDYFAQESSRRNAQIALIAEVSRSFLVLANDLALRELAEATAKNQEEWFALTKERHRLGAVSGLELSQSETTVESARADVARYEGNVAQDMNALRLLVGNAIPQDLLPQSADAQSALVAAVPVGLPSDVLLNRPDIVAAEHALRAANANIGAARAAFFPSISLTGDAGYASSELSGLFDADNKTWSFTPQINLPIFQGGRLRANLGVARVDRDIAVARYEQAIQIGFQEVSDALALADTLSRQRQAQERLVAASQRAYEFSRQLRESGQQSYLVLLDAQRSLYAAQQGLINTRLTEETNLVRLYQVLGGGWDQGS
ncbi:MAG TPA: efflux transporter outer membrane subunit [Steroidobacteraceae bacterium]|nr:efflux transporter outer membrane subunit [Steroidobacteraceae bacterium]